MQQMTKENNVQQTFRSVASTPYKAQPSSSNQSPFKIKRESISFKDKKEMHELSNLKQILKEINATETHIEEAIQATTATTVLKCD